VDLKLSSSSLSTRLAALREYEQPVATAKLLAILAPFLYHLSFPAPDGNNSDRVQTIHYLMETWYVRQNKSDTVGSSGRYSGSGFSCCYQCGSVLGSGCSAIALSCGCCQKPAKLTFFFLADLLDHCYQIPHPVTVKIISDYLGERYYERHQRSY
jgi:hypothetical protein